jgi:hypothetical protein
MSVLVVEGGAECYVLVVETMRLFPNGFPTVLRSVMISGERA